MIHTAGQNTFITIMDVNWGIIWWLHQVKLADHRKMLQKSKLAATK